MVPEGHRGVVVCGTRQAERWRDAFAAAGITAVVIENDDDGGSYKVCVPERKLIEANAIVTEVLSGTRTLPGPKIGWQMIVALVALASLVAGLLAR